MPLILSQNYISQFGQDILKRTDVIVEGYPRRIEQLPRGGAHLISLEVLAIYHGRAALGQTVYIYTFDFASWGKQEKWVVFLRRLASQQNFQMIGSFSLQEQEAIDKIQVLQELLRLEFFFEPPQKYKMYIEYCLSNLNSKSPWVRSHAFREWKHILQKYPNFIESSHIQKLGQICEDIPELSIRSALEKDILWLKKRRKHP